MEEEWYEGAPAREGECDETIYYDAEEKDETMYYDAEAEESVYYEAEADETVYYEANCDGAPENIAKSRGLAEAGGGYNATPDIRGAFDEPSEKGEYDVPPERGEAYEGAPEGGEVYEGAPEGGDAYEGAPEGGEAYEGVPEGGEEYEETPEIGEAFDEQAEEYDVTPGNGEVEKSPEDRRPSFPPSNNAQASGVPAGKEQVPRARPRSFMAQMASLLLKRRGCRGRASVERYKEARNLKRKTAARAKRSELNKICWDLSKAADETEPETGWAERQKEKVRAWRAEREAKANWAASQLKFILEWRESQNAYALRQYKRALSQAGVFRAPQRPTLSQQLDALVAYRARKKREAFYEAENRNWAHGAGGQAVKEDIQPNSPKAAINQLLAEGFSPMYMLPPELWFQPPFKTTRGLLPTPGLLPMPKNTQTNLSKAAVEQDPAPINPDHVAPQATWHEAPLNGNHGVQELIGNIQPNPQPPIRRNVAPGSERLPTFPVPTRPHASWHQAPMNVKPGLLPTPWC